MTEGKPRLTCEDLRAGGFHLIGRWVAPAKGGIALDGKPQTGPGVYAYVVDDAAKYIGLASQSLAKRFYFYQRPGSGQRTNIRLNGLIRSELDAGSDVLVYVAEPPNLEWNGWPINGAAGLEAGLISAYSLPWNMRSAVVSRTEEVAAATRSKRLSGGSAAYRTDRRGKYGPLRTHLEQSGKDKVSMSFTQIEELVGQLPKSAYLHQAWWGNHEGNSQAKAWMGARYLVEANPARRSVIFRKFSY